MPEFLVIYNGHVSVTRTDDNPERSSGYEISLSCFQVDELLQDVSNENGYTT
jgi:hypothetical protein